MTSTIEWTTKTWNPVTGCTKISAGCKLCYADFRHNIRHKAYQEGKLQTCPQYARPFSEIQFIESRLTVPRHWRKGRRVFVNSVSDLFHEGVSNSQIQSVLDVCAQTPRHSFQILTKRPERLADFSYPDNVWLGVTVENQDAADKRIPLLKGVRAKIRFLSCEPLLEPLRLDLDGVHWVIAGGETGKTATLRIYDVAGRMLDQVDRKITTTAPVEIRWNGVTRNGMSLASGIYFYSVSVSDVDSPIGSGKIALVR